MQTAAYPLTRWPEAMDREAPPPGPMMPNGPLNKLSSLSGLAGAQARAETGPPAVGPGTTLPGLGPGQPEAGADPMIGRRLDGRYTLEALIGEGATGRVYRARQEATGRLVAVKLLRESLLEDPRSLRRFQREARTASRVNHPNAIIVHDFGKTADGHVYLVTELIDGETLRAHLSREGLLPPERALWIFREILAGVAAAHERGVVHRDLHPGNIFLCRDTHGEERVKVFDFGGARLLDSQQDGDVTGAGHLDLMHLLGSIRYLPPESLQRDRPPDPRVDVYALGLILFELCTGKHPFDVDDPLQVMAMHLREPPPLLSAYAPERAFSPVLQGLVAVMLAKDPTLRPRDAGQVERRLQDAEDREALITLREVVPEPEVEMEMEALPADEELAGGAASGEGAGAKGETAASGAIDAPGATGPADEAPGAAAQADQAAGQATVATADQATLQGEAVPVSMPVAGSGPGKIQVETARVRPAVPPPRAGGGGRGRGAAARHHSRRALVAVLFLVAVASATFAGGTLAYRLYQRLHRPAAPVKVVGRLSARVPPPAPATPDPPVPAVEPPPAPLRP